MKYNIYLKIFAGKESGGRAEERGQERRESRGGLYIVISFFWSLIDSMRSVVMYSQYFRAIISLLLDSYIVKLKLLFLVNIRSMQIIYNTLRGGVA